LYLNNISVAVFWSLVAWHHCLNRVSSPDKSKWGTILFICRFSISFYFIVFHSVLVMPYSLFHIFIVEWLCLRVEHELYSSKDLTGLDWMGRDDHVTPFLISNNCSTVDVVSSKLQLIEFLTIPVLQRLEVSVTLASST